MAMFRYDPKVTKACCDRNVPLLEKWFKDHPDRDDCTTNIGGATVRRGHVQEDLYTANEIEHE